MDIRPVDVQMFINKSMQTNRNDDFNQYETDKNLTFFEHFKKDIETDNKKTIESDKSNQASINKDGKGHSSYNNKKENKKEEKKKNTSTKSKSLGFLDISI